MAQVTLKGRLGADAELSYTQTKKALLSFSLATSKRMGQQFQTTWWPCKIWGDLGEDLRGRLKKGMQVIVEGDIEPREWKSKDGKSQRSLDVFVKAVGILFEREKEPPLFNEYEEKNVNPSQPTLPLKPELSEKDVPF